MWLRAGAVGSELRLSVSADGESWLVLGEQFQKRFDLLELRPLLDDARSRTPANEPAIDQFREMDVMPLEGSDFPALESVRRGVEVERFAQECKQYPPPLFVR